MQNFYPSILLSLPTAENQRQQTLEFLNQELKQKTSDNNSVQVTQPNIYFFNETQTALSIEQVRNLISQSSYTSYNNQISYFIILAADQATLPAQNALLKILEEPPDKIQIILTAVQPEKLLATIQSRCLLKTIKIQTQDDKATVLTAEQTMMFNPQSKYSQLIELAALYDDKTTAKEYLLNLIKFCHFKKTSVPLTRQSVQQLQSLHQAYQLLEKNVNVKLVLENCFFAIKHYH